MTHACHGAIPSEHPAVAVAAAVDGQHQWPDAQVVVRAGGPRGLIVSAPSPATAKPDQPDATKTPDAHLFGVHLDVA